MFQSFEVTASPEQGRERMSRLRETFDALGVDAVLVPRADEFQGEYVPKCAERLAWLTGFTGSAGVALVMRDRAVVFVDGRYTAQLAEQVDPALFEAGDLVKAPPATWIEENAPARLRLGIDPWLHTPAEVARLRKALDGAGGELVFLDRNPVDAVWPDRPALPTGAVSIQQESHAGQLASDKIAEMQAATAPKAAAVLLSDPSSVAWTFNIRGSDVPHTPHPLARAIVPATGRPQLFIARDKLGIEERAYLTQLADLAAPEAFAEALAEFGKASQPVMLDPQLTPYAAVRIIEENGGSVVEAPDPARLPRATKNETEIAGSRTAHRQDGAAMVRFLAWLDGRQPGSFDEIEAVRRLEGLRAEVGRSMQIPLKDISFDTIAGAGPHGAIIHYRVNEQTNRRVGEGELFLVDSGAQYVAGTTDITRTVAIGTVSDEPKRFFTLVLKGMIAISRLRFPESTRGADIDAFARHALWQAGADFAHGTGHGVGSYLSVHEGPQTISRRGTQELLPGMILSNEPGYYREGAYGIRIENLVVVHEPRAIEGGDKPMLGFETLTLAPIDRRLIRPGLLDMEETAWLDAYHARVRSELMPLIEEEPARRWLVAATEPLDR